MSLDQVVVSAPAHLHAGNYELSRLHGRVLGTVGLTVSWPRTTVRAWRCSGRGRAEGPYAWLAEEFLEALDARGVCLRVYEAVSRGVGLGGTTALALSVAVAVRGLAAGSIGFEQLVEDALRLGRARWTGLGLYGFAYGGFIVDGGVAGKTPPPLIARHPVPGGWRVVVAVIEDRVAEIRELKKREEEVLRSLPRAHDEVSARLARLVLAGALPCLAEKRLDCLVESLWRYNHELGSYWAGLGQKGVYCCREAEELVNRARERGVLLIQSSWGPALWTLVERGRADAVAGMLRGLGSELGVRLTVWHTAADNYGAVTVPGWVAGWRPCHG